MKSQKVLYLFLISILFQSTSEDPQFFNLFNHFDTNIEKTVIGRLNEDVILPCSFDNEPEEIVIHWKIQDTGYVHTYYQDRDHLENQDSRYKRRTSLFHSEIHNRNASLCLRRLSLQDEGNYTCYVGTRSGSFREKVVLKVGAFVTPVMKYEKRNTSSILICSILSVYPRPSITWHMNNTHIPDSKVEEIGSLGSFYINSTVNITGPDSYYECAIKNSLFEQTWKGRWTMKDDLHTKQSEQVLFSCDVPNNFFLPNQDFIVTWSRMENGIPNILAYFVNSSQNITISEPRLSWKKELIIQGDFSSILKDLSIPDNGEYLCNISSSTYTLLTIQTLHVAEAAVWNNVVVLVVILVVLVVLVVMVGIVVKVHKLRRHPSPSAVSNSGGGDQRRQQEMSSTDNAEEINEGSCIAGGSEDRSNHSGKLSEAFSVY
ncbi:HERV-H LTR-associating protein 2 [Talpa occidentalis]|uniref:HERV-H LTR-associating protein 2 n=1 Tax=Talpa occidentalis TaxID=50954 RepID=UPI0023F9BB56|nr:HERV-H LTR-associating protein 2 [Talpa occidentalis]